MKNGRGWPHCGLSARGYCSAAPSLWHLAASLLWQWGLELDLCSWNHVSDDMDLRWPDPVLPRDHSPPCEDDFAGHRHCGHYAGSWTLQSLQDTASRGTSADYDKFDMPMKMKPIGGWKPSQLLHVMLEFLLGWRGEAESDVSSLTCSQLFYFPHHSVLGWKDFHTVFSILCQPQYVTSKPPPGAHSKLSKESTRKWLLFPYLLTGCS